MMGMMRLVSWFIFFPGQLNQILNIDKSEVSTDGRSKIYGSWPVIECYCSHDDRVGSSAKAKNKSGYNPTFIGGSTMSGWPVPPYFQAKSLAKTEGKRKPNPQLFKDTRNIICGTFGFGEVTTCGVTTINYKKKARMDNQE